MTLIENMSSRASSLTPGTCLGITLCLATACSQTRCLTLLNRILISTGLLELLQGPLRAPPSAPIRGKITGTGLMKGETLIEVLDKLNRINNHGVSFLGIDPEDVAVVEHQTLIFIALIHPIQWTIALPVGATGPAKRQKKTSCIYYRQDRSQSVHSPGGASYFISCLPLDVIASFSFGAKECAEDFLQRYVFEILQRTLPSFLFFY